MNRAHSDQSILLGAVTDWATGETILPALAAAIVSTTQTFDADNRLLTHNGAATTFDADGNLLSVASGLTPSSYTYDARNRLTAAGGLTYTYNSENRRVGVTDASGTTLYAVNPNAVPDQVLIKTAPGGTKTFYVYGLGLLHEETGGTPRYYHFDRRGDTIALTDNAGVVTGRVAYGVYGEILSQTGTIATPFLFNGKWGVQTDANGLYHHRARYYHPALRRFLNQDTVLGSIGDSASMNRFAYANGNPVSLIDPFGLMGMDAPNSGGLIAIGNELYTTGALREEYIRRAAQLSSSDTAGRVALQNEFRALQTSFGKARTAEFLETHIKSVSNAAKTNTGINSSAGTMKLVGRGAQAVAIGVEVTNVMNAPDGQRGVTAARGAGRLAGGSVGGVAGAQIGLPLGPYGVLAGAVLGGIIGSFGGEVAVDALPSHAPQVTTEEFIQMTRGI